MSFTSGGSPIFGTCLCSAALAAPIVKNAANPNANAFMVVRSPWFRSVSALFPPVPGQEAAHRPVHRGFHAQAEQGQEQDRDERFVVLKGTRVEENVEAE